MNFCQKRFDKMIPLVPPLQTHLTWTLAICNGLFRRIADSYLAEVDAAKKTQAPTYTIGMWYLGLGD
jgi:hypothetical protein